MEQQNTSAKRRLPYWFLISCALWLALTIALSGGGGIQPASAQQNGPQPTVTVEATQTPSPTPSEECPYVP